MDDGEEKIAIGPGVGFKKEKKDIVNQKRVEKLFISKENEKLQQLLLRIPEEHFMIAEEIIAYAEERLGTELNEHIRIALTDHISFAIEREKQGIRVNNKLLPEIRVLYKQEFEIGVWAVKLLEKRFNLKLPIDEAAFIALHVHSMKVQDGDLRETVRQTSVLKDMVQMINETLGITIEKADIAYERLIHHLRFAMIRLKENEQHTMDVEMIEMIKRKFPVAYNCSAKVANTLSKRHGMDFPEDELGYITLHIERLRKM